MIPSKNGLMKKLRMVKSRNRLARFLPVYRYEISPSRLIVLCRWT